MTKRVNILGFAATLLTAGLILIFANQPQTLPVSPPPASPPPPATEPPPATPALPPAPPAAPTPPAEPPPQPQPGAPAAVPLEISRGNTAKKQVIFTFDGGAGIHSAQKILDVLAKHGLVSTFFVTGKWAEQNPALTRQISSAGHEIFNHTYSHPDLTKISEALIRTELQKTENIITDLTGKTTKPYFRPPYGARNLQVRRIAAQEGYTSVYWTVDALDWKEGITAEEVKQRILNNLSNGAIYLMHIGDNITGDILDEVFTEIKNRGYSITSFTQGMK